MHCKCQDKPLSWWHCSHCIDSKYTIMAVAPFLLGSSTAVPTSGIEGRGLAEQLEHNMMLDLDRDGRLDWTETHSGKFTQISPELLKEWESGRQPDKDTSANPQQRGWVDFGKILGDNTGGKCIGGEKRTSANFFIETAQGMCAELIRLSVAGQAIDQAWKSWNAIQKDVTPWWGDKINIALGWRFTDLKGDRVPSQALCEELVKAVGKNCQPSSAHGDPQTQGAREIIINGVEWFMDVTNRKDDK